MPRLYAKLWVVNVVWQHWGVGAFWTFIVSAPEDWIAIEKVKAEADLPKGFRSPEKSPGRWSFGAAEIDPSQQICEVAHNMYTWEE